MYRNFIFIVLMFGVSCVVNSKDEHSELFEELNFYDGEIFERGFNQCEVEVIRQYVADDLEFYHDQAGITRSGESFANSIENGLCKMEYRAIREIVPESVEVFPLKNGNEVYGAIQKGEHHFFAVDEDGNKSFTSRAIFTHVWLKSGDDWKLSRVLSYDHQTDMKN